MTLYIARFDCRQTCLSAGAGTSKFAPLVDRGSVPLKSRYDNGIQCFCDKKKFILDKNVGGEASLCLTLAKIGKNGQLLEILLTVEL